MGDIMGVEGDGKFVTFEGTVQVRETTERITAERGAGWSGLRGTPHEVGGRGYRRGSSGRGAGAFSLPWEAGSPPKQYTRLADSYASNGRRSNS